MHKRSLLVGIGIGMIIGVLLLELFQLGEKGQQQLTQIEQQLNEGASPTPSPSIAPEATEAPLADQNDQSEVKQPSEPQQPAAPEVSQAEEKDNLPTPSVEGVEKPKVSYILRVYHGDTIKKTGKRLAENGIIDDADEFVSYFRKNDATIRAGFFYVEELSELEDLRKMFSAQPLTEAEANEQITTKGLKLIQ